MTQYLLKEVLRGCSTITVKAVRKIGEWCIGRTKPMLALLLCLLLLASLADVLQARSNNGGGGNDRDNNNNNHNNKANDPGVRQGLPNAGSPLPNLTSDELQMFNVGKEDFEEAEGVGDGLGPRFNLEGCGGCHAQPEVGGTSPALNPQFAAATDFGANNFVPFFVDRDGPVREARFKYVFNGNKKVSLDGGVHAIYTISGRVDTTGDASRCNLKQDDFQTEFKRDNLIFRIPTPTFGAGLIEQISDRAIRDNYAADRQRKAALGIFGHPNFNGNDGTIARFGWKAQNKSLLLFSGEAYNVEMGITNELFQAERDETANCQFAPTPNDTTNAEGVTGQDTISAIEKFSFFMRFLSPPTPSLTTPGGAASITNGRALFKSVGCAYCHTPTFTTGSSTVAALSNQSVNLYSDLLLHKMGVSLADGILQGQAGMDEFRTAPLWGLGQRIFFLHDGRTDDLLAAIGAHSSTGSEAREVIGNFTKLKEDQKQDLLNFLRSL